MAFVGITYPGFCRVNLWAAFLSLPICVSGGRIVRFVDAISIPVCQQADARLDSGAILATRRGHGVERRMVSSAGWGVGSLSADIGKSPRFPRLDTLKQTT